METLAFIKTAYEIRKLIPVAIVIAVIFIAGIFSNKQIIKNENQIPIEIRPLILKISKLKNIDPIKFADVIYKRSNFGRIKIKNPDILKIPNMYINKINLDLFKLENIFKLPDFTPQRFFLVQAKENFYGFMLLSQSDIDKYGKGNPYSYESSLNMLAEKFMNEDAPINSQSGNKPKGIPTCCYVTQRFGQAYPDYILKNLRGVPLYHTGLDIADVVGKTTYVNSTLNGVAKTGYDRCGGNYITVTNKEYRVYYGHLEKVLVKNNDVVRIGQRIGIQGSTGVCTTGKHTHYEVYEKGKLVDPEKFK